MGSSLRLSDFVCGSGVREMEGTVFPADVPSLLVDDLDRYPPEPEDEEDQTSEHGREKAFHNSYWWYGLIRRCEPIYLQGIER